MTIRILPKNSEVDPQNSEDAPRILEELIRKAETARASDIHIQARSNGADVSFRLDGVLSKVCELPVELTERIFGRIKFLAKLKTYQELLPQDGRIDAAAVSCQNDIRVATYPTVSGEKVVLRLFTTSAIRTFDELQFPDAARADLQQCLRQPSGLILLTGPAGSGKTTTIYACLQFLVQLGGRHIITIEDPAEQIIPGVMQTEVSEARGLSYAKAARHLLRQDPQALVIGEIRDEETANIAVRAALTGHLVISTLHAGSCVGVLERLLVLVPDHSAVAASLELILNQRLIRRFCASCRGTGCSECLNSGYRGRIPIAESFRMTSIVRPQIAHRRLNKLIPQVSLLQAARSAATASITAENEIQRVLGCTQESR